MPTKPVAVGQFCYNAIRTSEWVVLPKVLLKVIGLSRFEHLCTDQILPIISLMSLSQFGTFW